jgi:hypothetical protein
MHPLLLTIHTQATHSSPSSSSHNLKIEDDDADIPVFKDSHDVEQAIHADSSRSPSRPSSKKSISPPKGALKVEPDEDSPPSPLSEDGAESNRYYDANEEISNTSANISMEMDAHLRNSEDVQMTSAILTGPTNRTHAPSEARIIAVEPNEPALGAEQPSRGNTVNPTSHTIPNEELSTIASFEPPISPSMHHVTERPPQQATPETPQFVRPTLLIKTPSAPTINLSPYTFLTPGVPPSGHNSTSLPSTSINNEGSVSVGSQPAPGPALPAIAPPSTPVKITYKLPPINTLPAEFNHKGKPGKKRRDKGADGSGSASKKDDWTPMGINKWGAVLRANPVHKRLSQATKCLSSHDWNVSVRCLS